MTMLALADLTPMDTGIATTLIIATVVLTLASFVLVVAAVFNILLSQLDVPMKIVWSIFVFAAPLIGALLWFFVGRKRVPAKQNVG